MSELSFLGNGQFEYKPKLILEQSLSKTMKQIITFTTIIKRVQEEFEDIKGVIRIRISKKDRQHNGQKKKNKRTNNDLKSYIPLGLTMGQ